MSCIKKIDKRFVWLAFGLLLLYLVYPPFKENVNNYVLYIQLMGELWFLRTYHTICRMGLSC